MTTSLPLINEITPLEKKRKKKIYIISTYPVSILFHHLFYIKSFYLKHYRSKQED